MPPSFKVADVVSAYRVMKNGSATCGRIIISGVLGPAALVCKTGTNSTREQMRGLWEAHSGACWCWWPSAVVGSVAGAVPAAWMSGSFAPGSQSLRP